MAAETTAAAPACRACGCTDERACPGGCGWFEPDLCTNCAQLAAAATSQALYKALVDSGTSTRIATLAAADVSALCAVQAGMRRREFRDLALAVFDNARKAKGELVAVAAAGEDLALEPPGAKDEPAPAIVEASAEDLARFGKGR